MTLRGIFASGTVTGFSGATGLLETILGIVCGTKTEGENLSGSGVNWSGTVSGGTPVGLGSMTINYTISSTDYTMTDDGEGNFDGDDGSTGTINYSTGAYSITLSDSPDSTPTCDYIVGNDGQDWELLLERNARDNGTIYSYTEPFGSDCKEVVLKNRGISGAESVLVGIREWYKLAYGLYGWNLNGYHTFDESGTWNQSSTFHGLTSYSSTYDNFTIHPNLTLIDDTMYYWLLSNRQRIIVIVKVQSSYVGCYLGFGDRHGNPSDYPYPLIIKANSYSSYSYGNTTQQYNNFLPYSPSGTGVFPQLIGILPDNSFADNNVSSANTTGIQLYPIRHWSDDGDIYASPDMDEVLMSQVIGFRISTGQSLWDMDSIVHLAGVGLQSEDILKGFTDKFKYIVFPNVLRTGYKDWMGIPFNDYSTTTSSTTTSSSTSTTSSSTTTTTA